jgi:hypothetical protein
MIRLMSVQMEGVALGPLILIVKIEKMLSALTRKTWRISTIISILSLNVYIVYRSPIIILCDWLLDYFVNKTTVRFVYTIVIFYNFVIYYLHHIMIC